MGRLRERRRKNRQKKLMMQVGIGGGILTVVLLAFIIWLNGSNPKPNDKEVVQIDTQANKQLESSSEIIEEPETMQIVMVGDVLMHDKIINSGLQEDGTYNFDHLFANVKDTISEADFAIVNQETIMGGPSFGYTGYPSFNSPQELADAEVKAGFDLLLLATNHALDKGGKGVENCMAFLDENHPELDYVGINHSQEEQDESIYTYEANGITVAVLNYTYGTNGIPHPSSKPYLVNLLKEDKIRSDIQKAEEDRKSVV